MISFFIEESYKLLLNEKENYYGDNSFPKIEEEKFYVYIYLFF